jgi:hypothetical protein
VSCAGDKIAVGYESGAVLTLHASWLKDGGCSVSKVGADASVSWGLVCI